MILSGGFCGEESGKAQRRDAEGAEKRAVGRAKAGPYKGKNPKLFSGVAAEEGVGLPTRAGRGVGGLEQKAAGEFFVARGSLEIDWLVYVVGGGVVAVGEPVLEDFLVGRTEFETDVDFYGRNALLDEAVLIAADEAVA